MSPVYVRAPDPTTLASLLLPLRLSILEQKRPNDGVLRFRSRCLKRAPERARRGIDKTVVQERATNASQQPQSLAYCDQWSSDSLQPSPAPVGSRSLGSPVFGLDRLVAAGEDLQLYREQLAVGVLLLDACLVSWHKATTGRSR